MAILFKLLPFDNNWRKYILNNIQLHYFMKIRMYANQYQWRLFSIIKMNNLVKNYIRGVVMPQKFSVNIMWLIYFTENWHATKKHVFTHKYEVNIVMELSWYAKLHVNWMKPFEKYMYNQNNQSTSMKLNTSSL